MAYRPKHDYRSKDALERGDPDKKVMGRELSEDFEAISTDLKNIHKEIASEGGEIGDIHLEVNANTESIKEINLEIDNIKVDVEANAESIKEINLEIDGIKEDIEELEDSIVWTQGEVDPDTGLGGEIKPKRNNEVQAQAFAGDGSKLTGIMLDQLADVNADPKTNTRDDLLIWNGTNWVADDFAFIATALRFKGGIAPTANAPATPEGGDLYVFDADGTLNASWGVLSGTPVAAGKFVGYAADTHNRWYLLGNMADSGVMKVSPGTGIDVDDSKPSEPVVSIDRTEVDTWYAAKIEDGTKEGETLRWSTADSEWMPNDTLIVKGDNVGIGVAPHSARRLHIDGGAEQRVLRLSASTDEAKLEITSNTSPQGVYISSKDNGMVFETDGQTPRLTIDENGNVGIGVDTPAEKLSIWGNGSPTSLYVYDGSGDTAGRITSSGSEVDISARGSANSKITLTAGSGSGVKALTINSNGNVGIGMTPLRSTAKEQLAEWKARFDARLKEEPKADKKAITLEITDDAFEVLPTEEALAEWMSTRAVGDRLQVDGSISATKQIYTDFYLHTNSWRSKNQKSGLFLDDTRIIPTNYADGGANGTSDGEISLGNSSLRFKDAHFSGTVNAGSFVKAGGTSSQYLMADGSVSTGGGGAVDSVNGKTGVVVLSASDVGAEPAFSKNSAFNKNFGTAAGTVSQGNHTHSQYLTDAPNDGKQYARKSAAWAEVVSSGGASLPDGTIEGQMLSWSTGSKDWIASNTGVRISYGGSAAFYAIGTGGKSYTKMFANFAISNAASTTVIGKSKQNWEGKPIGATDSAMVIGNNNMSGTNYPFMLDSSTGEFGRFMEKEVLSDGGINKTFHHDNAGNTFHHGGIIGPNNLCGSHGAWQQDTTGNKLMSKANVKSWSKLGTGKGRAVWTASENFFSGESTSAVASVVGDGFKGTGIPYSPSSDLFVAYSCIQYSTANAAVNGLTSTFVWIANWNKAPTTRIVDGVEVENPEAMAMIQSDEYKRWAEKFQRNADNPPEQASPDEPTIWTYPDLKTGQVIVVVPGIMDFDDVLSDYRKGEVLTRRTREQLPSLNELYDCWRMDGKDIVVDLDLAKQHAMSVLRHHFRYYYRSVEADQFLFGDDSAKDIKQLAQDAKAMIEEAGKADLDALDDLVGRLRNENNPETFMFQRWA